MPGRLRWQADDAGDLLRVPRDSFVLNCSAHAEESYVDGENILAMANTIFAYEGDCPVAQAEHGYNMAMARFNATSRCGGHSRWGHSSLPGASRPALSCA